MRPALLILIGKLFTMTTCAQENPKDTEVWEPEPPVVQPGNFVAAPPADAIILLDENGLSAWESTKGEPAGWQFDGGVMTVKGGAGDIRTKQKFGSCQLHIEWRTPGEVSGEGQGRGNSGIFLMDRYEVQILDSWNNRTYSNGQAGSIYKQYIPLVNASKAPGEWQSFDIYFTAPKFSSEGELISPAYITVLHNGVLIHNHVAIQGITAFRGKPKYEAHGEAEALRLQDHGNPVSFRNIWIREL